MFVSRRSISAALAASMALGACASGQREASDGRPEVRTRSGRVRGVARNGASLFMGIPYGADASGARRFLPPAPVAPWSGVREAVLPGPKSPQAPAARTGASDIAQYFTGGRFAEFESLPDTMGENCLVLNVVTPNLDRQGRPVLFYIHGGGFTGGSGQIISLCDRLAVREDVVLVSVNHRLGALGFLYLGGLDPTYAQGNPGMLDLVAALEWVRDNIAAFGGDPDKVTLFGESGGGAKISLLMAMPQARGLFRAAIIQSGLKPELPSIDAATATARSLMERVGARTIDELRATPADKLTVIEGPMADGHTLRAGMWDTAPAAAADIPLIIGYCKDETTLFSLANPALFGLDWPGVQRELASQVRIPDEELAAVIDLYRAAFPSDGPSDCYFRISSETLFGRDAVTLAERKSRQAPPVYFYRMEYDTGLAPGLRAFHTAELPLAMGLSWQQRAEALSEQISSAWAAFARRLDPNHAGMPTWKRFDAEARQTMILDLQTRCIPDPQAASRARLFEAMRKAAT